MRSGALGDWICVFFSVGDERIENGSIEVLGFGFFFFFLCF